MQFGLSPGFRVFQTVPEPAQEITHLLQNGRPWFDPSNEAVLERNNNQIIAAFATSRIVLIAQVNFIRGDYYINFWLQLPQSFFRRIRGFFGNFDGNLGNEFYRRGETNPLPNNIGERSIFVVLNTCKF